MTWSIRNSILAFVRRQRNRDVLSWAGFDGRPKSGHNMRPRMCGMTPERRFTPELRRQAVQLLNTG